MQQQQRPLYDAYADSSIAQMQQQNHAVYQQGARQVIQGSAPLIIGDQRQYPYGNSVPQQSRMYAQAPGCSRTTLSRDECPRNCVLHMAVLIISQPFPSAGKIGVLHGALSKDTRFPDCWLQQRRFV
jgi:hypothetical protein